jgi:hypothetical protein
MTEADGDIATKIYTILSALQPGTLGPRSEVVETPPCEVCQQTDRPRIKYLDLRLDGWTPCDLVSVSTTFAVSPALHDRMVTAGVRGAVFRDMRVSRSDLFDIVDPDHRMEMPQLVQLDIEAVVPGPSGWWDAEGKCKRCGRVLWKGSAATSAALGSTARRPKGPQRLINRKDWGGENLFWTTDPGPPLMTEKVRALLDPDLVPHLVLHPARFV